jgi:tetratricopeptide (TPR) repeat protein
MAGLIRILMVLMALMGGMMNMAAQTVVTPQSDGILTQATATERENGILTQATATEREYDILFHEAMLERQREHHDAAFDLLNRCLEIKPDASEVCFFLALYYSEMEAPAFQDSTFIKKTLALLERAVAIEPGNATYMEHLYSAYIANRHYDKAIAVLEQMYEADKGRVELLDMLYRLYAHAEDFEQAVSVLDRKELIDGPSEALTLEKCRLFIAMDDADRAIREVRLLTERYPYDLRYRTLLANTLLVTNHDEEAFDLLSRVLDADPANVSAQQVLRNYYLRHGDEEAADSVNHVILLNPATSISDKGDQLRRIIIENMQQGGDSTMVLTLFNELLAQPNPSADIAELKAAYMQLVQMPEDSVASALAYVLTLNPAQASARLMLVQQAWQAQDDDRIISLCQEARQYNPEEMAFYYYQGMAYYRRQDVDNALEAFSNGIGVINEDSSPEIVSDFYAVMGDLLHQKGRVSEAFAAYDSCLHWKSDNIGCLNNYAYYLSLQNQRLEEAERMSYATVRAEPRNTTYLDTYAWILFMQHRYTEAKVYIVQALQNDDDPDAVILEHAGDIFALCNEMEDALAYWERALVGDPQNNILKKKIKRKKYIKK